MSAVCVVNAARKRNFQQVKSLVEAGADINSRNPRYQNSTAIFWAAHHESVEMIAFLMKHGADIDIEDDVRFFNCDSLDLIKYA